MEVNPRLWHGVHSSVAEIGVGIKREPGRMAVGTGGNAGVQPVAAMIPA